MAKRKRVALGSVNAEGWMMSYADMVTILLALFIVLSTLGKDQTGVNLNKGIESYRRVRDAFGLPGWFSNSSQVTPKDAVNARYNNPDDPDFHDDLNLRSIDGEEEQFQRFLSEMDRHFRVEKLPLVSGEATLDIFDPLRASPPSLPPKALETVNQIVGILHRSNYQVYVVVWAATPSDSAWTRAVNQAQRLVDEIARDADLDALARARLLPMGQPWLYSAYQRPVLSLRIVKLEIAP